jgi:hypothetical protein
MKRFLVCMIGALALVMAVPADDRGSAASDVGSNVFERYPSALGAYGVAIISDSGAGLGGLSYQRWLGRVGFEVAAGALVNNSGSFDYNIYGSLQYRIFGADFNDWFSGALYSNVLLGHSATGSTESYQPRAHLGIGIGIETVFLEHLAPSIEFMYVGSWPLSLAFGLGFSLRYRY